MRWIPPALLLLAALALSLPAAARDPFGSAGRHRPGIGRSTPGALPHHRAQRAQDSLRRFTAQRRAEAGVRLLEQRRDLERRSSEARLRRSGSRAQVQRYRVRAEAIVRADDLRVRQRLADADRAWRAADQNWWSGLGPNTRRVFERSGIAVRRAKRLQELRRDLDALEREVTAREARTRRAPFSR